MIPVVYAMGSETVGLADGSSVPVRKGTHWPAEDPVVKRRPGLFSISSRARHANRTPAPYKAFKGFITFFLGGDPRRVRPR